MDALTAMKIEIPEGWQLVPKEPTPKMVQASWDMAGLVKLGEGQDRYIAVAYQAMLAAAPPAPTIEEE